MNSDTRAPRPLFPKSASPAAWQAAVADPEYVGQAYPTLGLRAFAMLPPFERPRFVGGWPIGPRRSERADLALLASAAQATHSVIADNRISQGALLDTAIIAGAPAGGGPAVLVLDLCSYQGNSLLAWPLYERMALLEQLFGELIEEHQLPASWRLGRIFGGPTKVELVVGQTISDARLMVPALRRQAAPYRERAGSGDWLLR